MGRVAIVSTVVASFCAASAAQGAKLVVMGFSPTTDGLGGLSVQIGVDTEDAVSGFLGYQDLVIEGAHQVDGKVSPAGSPGPVNFLAQAELASFFGPGVNYEVNDTYFLNNNLSPTGPGLVGGGVGEEFGFTGAHTGLPVNVAGGIHPLINVRVLADGFYPITGIIARIDDTGGFWVDGTPGDSSTCTFGLVVSNGEGFFSICPEPSSVALAVLGACGAALLARGRRGRGARR